MRAKMIWAAVVTSLVGCGGSAMRAPVASTPAPAPVIASAAPALEAAMPEAAAEPQQAIAAIDPSTLPEAPWADAPLTSRDVPAPILAAWERADNRDVCAPTAPRSFGAADGARARASALEGGWAVEFDRHGMRGVARDGSICDTCGRGVFGVAGTSMTAEELAGEREAPAPSFRDGSHAELEVSEAESVAAATITVAGEGCVYQVWSFLGQGHVEELVRELRRVELPASRTAGTLARADR